MITTTVHSPGRISGAITLHPWRTVLRLLPAGIVVMLAVDAILGSRAEYFNAVHLVEAWGRVVTGGTVDGGAPFIAGQGSMAAPVALLTGSFVLFAEPAVVLAGIVGAARLIVRRRAR